MKSKSIAEKILELSNPGLSYHPDVEDTIAESVARVEDYSNEESHAAKSGLKQRRIPQQSFHLEDARYSGKKISRKDLVSDDESDQENTFMADFISKMQKKAKRDGKAVAADSEEESEGEEDVDDEMDDSGNELSDTQESEADEESEGDGDSQDEDGSGEEVEDEGDEMESEKFTAVSKGGGTSEAEKGRAIQLQFAVYDQLIESRIKLQKPLMGTNTLPQHSVWADFVEPIDSEGKTVLKKTQNSLKDLLDSLLDLQGHLLMQNPKTSGVVAKGKAVPKDEGSDQEIPSDTEEDEPVEAEFEPLKKRLKLQDYSAVIKERHQKFLPYRNEMIQYWNQRTKLASGKLSSKSFQKFEQSTLKQIELILADRERLVKRTQIKRSAYTPLGGHNIRKEEVETKEEDESGKKTEGFEYDTEVFDDDDFYHQVLRELIERKTSDSSDAAALGRQLLEIQKLRSKGKRKVDTKASKGRRIRYDVHTKLVNFMPPISQGTMGEEVTSDLFDSLFGRRVKSAGG